MPSTKVVRRERGWGGHFIGCGECLFRRNTLLTLDDVSLVVSTVGLYCPSGSKARVFEALGGGRHFETMAFHSDPSDARYSDADVTRGVKFASPWHIEEVDADDRANDMHEAVVEELVLRMAAGEAFGAEPYEGDMSGYDDE